MNYSGKKSGFTLVEMIVSLGIFSVVAVVALGALVKIISANQKAQSLHAAITNLNFALEGMTREIRVGSFYSCSNTTGTYGMSYGQPKPNFDFQPCAINNNAKNDASKVSLIAFASSRTDLATFKCNLATVYRFKNINGKIILQKAQQNRCPAAGGIFVGENDFSDVLSPNVELDDYRLGVVNDPGNPAYPYVVIRLIGHSGLKQTERTDFDIQSIVSSRIPQQ